MYAAVSCGYDVASCACFLVEGLKESLQTLALGCDEIRAIVALQRGRDEGS